VSIDGVSSWMSSEVKPIGRMGGSTTAKETQAALYGESIGATRRVNERFKAIGNYAPIENQRPCTILGSRYVRSGFR